MQINFGLAQRVVKENLKFMMGLLFILNLQVVAREIIGLLTIIVMLLVIMEYKYQVHQVVVDQHMLIIQGSKLIMQNHGDVHIHDGNLKLASGHGIDFYAYATSGNPSSNLLDDYEEGSWNPEVLNGWGILSPTYSEQDGKYIKIGRLVYVIFRLKLNGGSTNGNRIAIANFPFNAVTIGTSGYADGGYARL